MLKSSISLLLSLLSLSLSQRCNVRSAFDAQAFLLLFQRSPFSPSSTPPQALSGLDLYFSMARGKEDATALDMSKYMDTNYHYEVRCSQAQNLILGLKASESTA